jgi:hypothetical protein
MNAACIALMLGIERNRGHLCKRFHAAFRGQCSGFFVEFQADGYTLLPPLGPGSMNGRLSVTHIPHCQWTFTTSFIPFNADWSAKTFIILSGGSLGSWVDEERS